MDYLKKNASPNVFIGLMAARGGSGFYEQFDFRERPCDSPGMFRTWE